MRPISASGSRLGPIQPKPRRDVHGDFRICRAVAVEPIGLVRSARVLGGCIGCSIALAFADAYPHRAERLVLYSPAGGPRYRITQHSRFEQHAEFGGVDGIAPVGRAVRAERTEVAQAAGVGAKVVALAGGGDPT